MKRFLLVLIVALMLFPVTVSLAGGLLPSLNETIGKPMPSFGEALDCYPDIEETNADGSFTERYLNVTEEQFNSFSVYLEKKDASLQDYSVDNDVLTATIQANGSAFFLKYDSTSGEVSVDYPIGTYDEHLEIVKTYYTEGQTKRSNADWDGAVEAFTAAGAYRDATTQISETRYQEASAMEMNGDQEGAHTLFMSLGEYRDSFERANKPYYDLGLTKRSAKDWDGAIEAFTKAGTYSDSESQISETHYCHADFLLSEENYDAAAVYFKKIIDYKDSGDRVSEVYYKKANKYYNDGDYVNAYCQYLLIPHYEDTDKLLSSDSKLIKAATDFADLQQKGYKTVGNIFEFGRYKSDYYSRDEIPIKWIVLDIKDNNVLLISKYILDAQEQQPTGYRQNPSGASCAWEKSTLYLWLNQTFIVNAFNNKEREALVNMGEGKAFLLTYDEAVTYNQHKKGYLINDTPTPWWTRRTGYKDKYNKYTYYYYYIRTDGEEHDVKGSKVYGIRPAIWIDLSSKYFSIDPVAIAVQAQLQKEEALSID